MNLQDFLNEIENVYAPEDLMRINEIRQRLAFLRREKFKIGPKSAEIETIDMPFNQSIGVVFHPSLEVLVKLSEGKVKVDVIRPLPDDDLQTLTQATTSHLIAIL